MTRPAGRWLILTAGMGAGHDRAATLCAEDIRRHGGQARQMDILELLPGGVGRAIRAGYNGMLRGAPWLYERIFQTFFVDERRGAPGVYPLDALAGRPLRGVVERYRPDGLLSTFHLAGQVAGRLRRRGRLAVPSVVAITEPAAHRQWLHPGTDAFLCPFPWVADEARRRVPRAVVLTPGPVVDHRFAQPCRQAEVGLAVGERAVLVSGGSWGVGSLEHTAATLVEVPGLRPLVLCGHNESLRRRVARIPGCRALGWRDDVAELFAAASVLVDQSGGATCTEAFLAGLPAVLYRPLPGHGRHGAETLARHGLVSLAENPAALVEQVGRLAIPGPVREGQTTRAASVFTGDPITALLEWRLRSMGTARSTRSPRSR